VALGMALAFRFSAERGICSEGDAERVSNHLEAMGLTTTLGPIPASGDALVAHMRHDKKASGGRLPFILVRGIGDAFVDRKVELTDVAAFLDRQRA
jgi:3-dehydroquinate synthase